MEYYVNKNKAKNKEYAKKVLEEEKKYSTDLSTVSVNSFLDKANKYFSSADKSLRSTGYSTASKNAEERRKQAQELRMEALGVDRYLDVNKSSMDENTYKTLKQYVSEIGYETAKVTDAFDTAEDYYSQFSDREKFNDYRENIRQNAWLDKYQNKNYTDLNILASKMEDGDEKNWVKRYATSKYTPEEGYMEVSRLENVLDEYNRLLKGNVNDHKNQERLRDITSRYGGKDDLEALISQTRQRNTLYDRELERQKLTSVGDRESANYDPEYDYWAKSRTAVPTRQDIENYDIMMDNSTWQVGDDGRMYDAFGNEIDTSKRDANGKVVHPAAGSVNTSDRLGIYLAAKNDTTDYSVAERAWGTVDQILAEGDSRHWDRLSEDQINTYYYYLNKQGADAANRYLDLIQDTVNKELGEEIYSEMQDSNALKTLFGVKSGLEQFESGMGGFGRQLRGENDYVAPSAEQYAGAMARENLDGLWGVAYDTASTVANMAPSILAGTLANAFVPGAGFVGSLVMGAGASGNAYDQMINDGYTVDQARTYGALVGVSEVALESLLGGISEFGGSALSKGLQKAMTAADNALLKVAVNAGDTAIGRILSNMISEGTEEGLQEILGTWLKNLITHSEENVNWEEVAYSTLLGALTGGVFEGVSVGANALQTNAVRKDVGKTIMAADGGVDALKALALDVSGAGSKLVNQAEKVTGETAVGKNFTGKVIAAAKNSANQKRIGKLYEGVRSEVSAQNRTDIAKLLGEKGFSSTSAKNIAEAIAARINGDETNKFQDMVLDEVKDNSAVNEVVKTVLTDEASLVSKRTTDLDLYSLGVAAGKGIEPTKTERPDYDVSEDGKTILHNTDGTAREVEVKKVSEIKDGKVKLELNDGTVVDADQVSFASNGEAWTYSVMAEIGATAEEANDILSFYEGSTDIDRVAYARGIQEAYRYGTIGVPVDKISAASFASRMSPEARAYAYNVGAIQAVKNANVKYNERISKKLGKGKYHDSFTIERNGVHFDDVDISAEKLNAYQKTGIQLAEFLAALGMDVHVFKSQKVDGKYVSENGSYIMDDGSIHVDLMAGNIGQGTVAYTLSHETTHFIKDWSPEKFKVFADALFAEVGKSDVDSEKMVAGTLNRVRSMKEYKGKSEAELWDIAYDEVVAEMCETMLSDTDVAVRVAENLKKTDSELLNKIIEFFNNLLTKLKGLLKVNAAYKNATPDSYIAQQASETIKKVEKLRDLYAEALVDATATFRNAQAVEAVGIQVDAETESVAPMELHSERTWTASEYVQNREKAAQAISKELGVSVKNALQYIDDINSVARLIADDRVRLDYDANIDEHATVLKANSEYKYTVDMSTLCAKRLLFTGTFDAIQRALPNTVFDSEDIVRLREMMMQRNLEVACGICYVESTRREIGRITQEFIDRYKIAQQTGKPISRINSSGKEVTLTSKGATFMADPNYTPNLGELNTTDIDYVKRDHREVYDAYLAFMNARGQAKPKLLETRAEYKGEILKSFKAKSAVNARNAHGGLRLQSFSDFEVPHMIDMMQIIMDMSRVGLQSQAYTKVPAFAEVFGGTGVKINLSLIAKGSGLDANGNLIFDDMEGINHKEAFRLREKYSKDVGTILVGKNDQHIIAAMADPRIDYIIPFHKSSWKESLYDALGLTGYEDYTETQNEKPFDKSRDIKNFDPSEYWDFTKTGDENAQIYLQKCREDGRIPKFPQFQGYPGYWKLLIDFKMYDNNGVGSPQQVVRPNYDMDAARSILNEYKGGHRSFPVAKDVVNDFVNEHKANNASDARKSSRNDAEYLDAVKRGDMNTAQRLVDAFAKRTGFTSPDLFHGTSKFGFTKFDPAFSDDKISIFLSSNNLVAETYSGKTEKYKVSQRATITPEELDKASPETILKLLQENVDYRIEMISEGEMNQLINKHRSELKNAIRMAEQVPVIMADKWNDGAQKDLEKVIASLKKLSEASGYNEFMDAYDEYEGALFDMRWENDAATNVLYELIRDDVNSAYRGLTNYIGTTLYRGNTEYTKRNGKDIFNINEAVSELYKVLYRGVYRLYTNPGNQLVIDAEGSNWNQIDGKHIGSNGPVRTRDVAKYAKENGYDSVRIKNLRDSGDYSYMGHSDVYIFFGGNRLKSADPVTYDDDGNVIPLSKRFDLTNKDIRYASRQTDLDGYVDRSNAGGYDFTKSFAEQLSDYKKGLFPKDESFIVGATPNVLLKVGLSRLPVTMDKTHVSYALDGNYPGSEERKKDHMIDIDNLANIIEKISDPVAIIQDRQLWQKKPSGYSVDVLIDMELNGKKVLIPVNINQSGYANKTEYDSNKLTTVHGDVDTVQRLANALNEHSDDNISVFYVNKEKASEFLQPTGHPISSTAAKLDGFIAKVTDKGSNVKMRISSETESRQFIRWFGDWKKHPNMASKVVNADGTPKVVYHGTNVKFTVFRSKSGEYWFSESEDYAEAMMEERGGGEVKAVYLNMRNPYRAKLSPVQFSDPGFEAQILRDAKSAGHDGVIIENDTTSPIEAETFYVVFSPEQIKSATDNVGTFDGGNPDIRYSSRVKVDTTGMDEDAKKIIRKLEMISSFSKYDSGKYASYSAERMEREIRNSISATRMDYAKSYIAWIRPDDFLYATTTSEQIRAKIDAEAGDLDLERLRKETQPIHLTVDFETGKVVGHEGRHRMTALAKAGVEKVAVIIDAWNDDRYNTKPISMMDINGQEFGKYHTGTGFYAHDMLPISKRYADAVRQLFSDVAGSVRFSERTEDSVSNRSLLANALENTTQHEVEKTRLQEYKDKIAAMDAEEQKLSDINAQIKEISFGQGPRDTKKLSKLQQEKTKIQNRINTYDKQLLRLESTKVLQNVLAREKQKAYKRAEARGQEALEAYKKAADKRYENFVNKQEEKRKNAVEARKRTEIRHKIQRVVNELNDLLLNESKTRHVPDSLKKSVAGALSILNMDTVAAEERAAKYAALIAKERAKDEPDQEKIDAYMTTMENILRKGEKMGQKLKELKEAYEEIENSTDPDIALAYDPVIAGAIKELSQTIGDTSIMDMSIEQLSDVYDVYKMVLTRVRDANKAMAENIKATISQMASNVISEVRAAGGQHKMRVSMLDPVKKFFWNNLKPVYAMEYIGSNTLTHVFNNVRAGEDVWAKDVTEARAYYLDKVKKYGYNKWDLSKKYRFASASDLEFDLTLEQMLSLYAYSKREQAHDHLRLGGFVFDSNIETTKEKNGIIKYKVNTADAHQITPEILAEIISKLTSEQLGFVDEMQAYLSTTMGAKGNEVTSKMYGVKLFKEKNYFPLKSASQFMFEQNQVAGEVRIKNSGFTNKVVAKANNPIILSNFMDVWSNHVNEMSMYHAFTLPLEDFNRVFNFDSPKQEGIPAQSVKGTIQNAYTPAAVHYVKQLITDLNGGARTDPTTDIITKMMGLFKKGAVFASASVVIQQPSAIARATALIDTKYFIGPKVDQKKHKVLWEELKKYAPVAIIKEMGYFDTHMGKSTQDFIQGKEYEGIKEQFKALFTDSDYRDELLSKAPALADELAWVGIWEAVKRETKAKYPGLDVKGEPFLKLAGSRFTEVITKTQVYDSVLSRSANMRSKDTGMKMATAFMAEPTTSINMITDALLKGKRGNKKYARKAIGSVIASMLLNSMLVAFVYAGRDDDEDKNYTEKYIESFLGSVLDGLNPATYIPFIKDIMSIVQGYDVERSDMAVISDLWNAVQKLKSDKVSAYRKVEDFAGSIAQIFGLPVKNIMRDVRSVYQTLWPSKKQKTTAAGIGYAALSAVGKDVSDQEQLYRAFVNGNAEHLARVEGRYSTKKKANTAMRSAIKEHYLAGDITAETAMDYMVKYCDDKKDDAYWKIEEWNHEAKFEETFGKYDEFYGAVQTGKDLKATIKKYTDNGVTEETLRSQITDHFKEKYIKMTNAEKASIKGYLLNAMTTLGNTRQEAEDKIKDWEFEATHGFSYNNRRQEYLEGDITKEQLEDALVNYGGLDEEEVKDYFSDTLFEAEFGFPYNHTGKLYKDGTLSRDEAFHIFTTQGEMSAEKANVKIAELDFEIEHGFSYSEKRDQFISGNITATDLKQYMMSVENKTEEEANSAIVSYVRDAYSDGEIDRTFAINTMTRYAGVDAEAAENKLRYIDVKQQYPDTYVDDAWVEEYYEEIESSGISMDVFFEYRNQVKSITGKGKKENRLAVINSMPISDAQKDALYYAEGWAKSKIYEAPWH